MSQQYDNTNRGALFANRDRKTDNHPHASGTLNVEGVEYWLSAWTKTSSKGEKFQSLSVKRKTPREDAPIASEPDDLDDAIPF